MEKGEPRHKLETMIVASGKSGLQTVVRLTVKVREVVDLSEIGESRSKGQGAICGRSRWSLIEIHDSWKFYSMIANAGDVESQFTGERMLDAESPVLCVRGAEITVHGEGVARTRVGSSAWHIGAVTALNKGRECSGIDGRRLVLPVHAARARPCEVDGGGENVSDGRLGDRGNRAIISHHSHRASRNGSPGRNNAYANQY